MSAETAQNIRRTAHRTATQISQRDLIEALTSKLGARLVAFMANKSEPTISRWKSGAVVANEDQLVPLRVAYQIIALLKSAEEDPTIRAWFIGMNPQLDDLAPAEAIRENKNREALAAARAFLAGG